VRPRETEEKAEGHSKAGPGPIQRIHRISDRLPSSRLVLCLLGQRTRTPRAVLVWLRRDGFPFSCLSSAPLLASPNHRWSCPRPG
jgi:hypothetical protein